MAKSYSMNDLTDIGRKKFNLSNDWFCFYAEVTEQGKGNKMKYGLSRKDESGEWIEDSQEIYDFVSLI